MMKLLQAILFAPVYWTVTIFDEMVDKWDDYEYIVDGPVYAVTSIVFWFLIPVIIVAVLFLRA